MARKRRRSKLRGLRALRRSLKRKRTIRKSGFARKRRHIGIGNERLQQALAVLREQNDFAAAARAGRTTEAKFKREALKKRAIRKRGRKWIVNPDLRRQMLLYSEGQEKTITVSGYRRARSVGKYLAAVGNFLRSNDIKYLEPFHGRGVTDIAGKRHLFLTDPNSLYRLVSAGDQAFERIYKIVL
jgi:hypothetical protein